MELPMKAILIILALVGVTLFYPTYDLVVKADLFTEDFSVQETGFMTHKRCHQAAFEAKVNYYRCDSKTIWQSFFSKSSGYDPEVRYNTKSLSQ
jgi:hypothetical protein|tara:strand:+ start:1693 stop:1974 length:282 start_codon:yes stop_codon:yes gene_type:complete